MKRVYIYACDQIYGGLHGMNDYDIIEIEDEHVTIDNMWDYIVDMAINNVIDCYGEIADELYEHAQNNADDPDDEAEVDYLYEQEVYDDISGYWAVIDEEKAGQYSIEELRDLADEHDAEEFVKQFCKEME